MIVADIPKNETERLSALYKTKLLDSSDEESYDAITSAIALACDMPLAQICLIDAERVWIKSMIGGAVDIGRECPRHITFCQHTILQDDMLEVRDASKDPRFFDSPFVTSKPNIRYYAGVPLINQSGHALGTLVVADTKANKLSIEKKTLLKQMAVAVNSLIENKNTFSKFAHKTETKLHAAPDEVAKASSKHAKVFIVDDNNSERDSMVSLLRQANFITESFSSANLFLEHYHKQAGCLIVETSLRTKDGINIQEKLKELDMPIPTIFIAQKGDVQSSVDAMRAGAIDYLEKPIDLNKLIDSVREAISIDAKRRKEAATKQHLLQRLQTLTTREKQILELLMVNCGELSNKQIANKLNISHRTVEVHRSAIMAKMLARSRLELLEFAKICDMTTD